MVMALLALVILFRARHSVLGVRKVTPADFNTVTIRANLGSPHLKMQSCGPDRYINYANFHYTPVNCYLPFIK